MGKINNNNSSNSLFFGRWPQSKTSKFSLTSGNGCGSRPSTRPSAASGSSCQRCRRTRSCPRSKSSDLPFVTLNIQTMCCNEQLRCNPFLQCQRATISQQQMGLIEIITSLCTVLGSATNKFQQYLEKNCRECRETNPELLGEKQVSYLYAMQPPLRWNL